MITHKYIPNTMWIDLEDEYEPVCRCVKYGKGYIKCHYCGKVQYLLYEKFYCPNCGKNMIKDAYEKGGEN